MKAIIFALVLIMVACDEDPRPHIAQFTHQQAIADFSGMDKIFSSIPDFNLDPVDFQLVPGTLVEVKITDVKTHSVELRHGDVKCNIEIHKPVAHCVGVNMTASIKFKYVVRSNFVDHEGSANALMIFHDSYLDIEFTIDASGHPHYKPSVQLEYTLKDLNGSSEKWENDAITHVIEEHVQNDFNMRALEVLNDRAKKYYDKLAEGYKDTYKYYPPGGSHAAIDIDMTVVRVNSSMLGIVYEIDGSVAGIEPAPSTLKEVPYNLGKKQMVFTKEFALEFVAFANNNKFFIWNFEPNGALNMPSFDFLVADLWVIFPDSRKDFAAQDPLRVYCYGDRNEDPNVLFRNQTQRIEFQHRFTCSITHKESSQNLLNFTFTSTFEVEFGLRDETSEAVVTVYSVTPMNSVILYSKYEYGRRQLGIIDSLIKEALTIYNDGREVLGTGYKILPMQQADYEIYEYQLIIFGEPVPQPANATTEDDAPYML